jgi:thymidylate synthase (FAD)
MSKKISIYLISRPCIDHDEIEKFLGYREFRWLKTDSASSAEQLVELGGRICYMSFSEDPSKIRYPNSKYILNLIDRGHHSVLEHASWSFIIDGVSRALSHQLVRHRIGFSYSQLSQQYHDEKDAEFVVPAEIAARPELHSAWSRYVEHAHSGYEEFLSALDKGGDQASKEENRSTRSAARSLLPNATATTLFVSANARALRHFFSERGSILGDVEMRRLACAMFDLVVSDSPSLFTDFARSECAEGWPLVRRELPS